MDFVCSLLAWALQVRQAWNDGEVGTKKYGIHRMTGPPIEQMDLLDTDYADILASSNYPALEVQLLRLGIDPVQARTTSNFLAALRQKPNTPQQWAGLTKAWEAGYGFEPELEDFQQIIELLWNHQRRVENDG